MSTGILVYLSTEKQHSPIQDIGLLLCNVERRKLKAYHCKRYEKSRELILMQTKKGFISNKSAIRHNIGGEFVFVIT